MIVSGARKPGLLDRLDLLLLQLAKARRRENDGADGTFYEDFFSEDDVRKYGGELRSTWRLAVVRDVFDRCFPTGEASVLDVGCGLATAKAAFPSSVRYIGVDVSERTLDLARRIHRCDDLDLRIGGFPHLPVEPGTADFVLCLEVLEHVPDDVQAARTLREVTRPGGYVLVSVPGTYFWPQYERLIGHHRHYTPTSLERLLHQTGFEIVANLEQHREFWRYYYYLGYLPLKLVESIARVLRPAFDIFETSMYGTLERMALRRLSRRSVGDGVGSTFVLCRAA